MAEETFVVLVKLCAKREARDRPPRAVSRERVVTTRSAETECSSAHLRQSHEVRGTAIISATFRGQPDPEMLQLAKRSSSRSDEPSIRSSTKTARGRADADDPREAQGSQADHRGRRRTRQRRQSHGCLRRAFRRPNARQEQAQGGAAAKEPLPSRGGET